MRIISHRGNIEGPNILVENTPKQIDLAIQKYDVEIDIWVVDTKIYLGHDKPETCIDLSFLQKRKDKLWIHCKNFKALEYMNNLEGYNYFYHTNEDYILTSKGIVWVYPGKQLLKNSIWVMPENNIDINNIYYNELFGICTDYPEKIK